ncbi:Aste57867_12474 [Aphanomyces stellatus]|uniref:non-specific serine/threonine protein kinase n=1 Tax=Aphanomyces stellatus TaxID=120398 RepID=A0A485KX19_9STRA|nr:hypothetical protein As57867_012428 [Aphanomyces stellatus]VFT89325.1 Aste57867_12474 [Aphanomyces stellatus]
MNDRRRKLHALKVDRYDGQSIFINGELRYELGGYLGGGTAGVVYEAFCLSTKQHVALKILNPIGYKLMPTSLLSRCLVAIKGRQMESEVANGIQPMRNEHVWWLVHQSSKQAIAAYEDPRSGAVKELTLPRCIEVWGTDFDQLDDEITEALRDVTVKGQVFKVPTIPKKFVKFARNRSSIYREISNMSELDAHMNVLRLDDALELQQDSKCTIFLVLELAAGGELFDRIKLDCGTDEATARAYFKQLVSGVSFCHRSGVCHRDLKPENLLLADNEENSTLKIADFGLSAIFSITDDTTGSGHSIRRLRSVVGSPHYVAPEVLQDTGQGYDGAKADAWSIGIILYAMLAGNLPFGKELLKCLRYEKFKKWSYNTKYNDDDGCDVDPANDQAVEFPDWFFPPHFSYDVKSLIAQLIYPDPCLRLSVDEAIKHRWVLGGRHQRRRSSTSALSVQTDAPVDDLFVPSASPPPSVRGNPLQHSVSSPTAGSNRKQDKPHDVRWATVTTTAATTHGNIVRNLNNLHVTLTPSQPSASSLLKVSPHFKCPPHTLPRPVLHHPGYMPSLDETGPLHTPKRQQDQSQVVECAMCHRSNCCCDNDEKRDPFLTPPLAPMDDPVGPAPTPFSLSTW